MPDAQGPPMAGGPPGSEGPPGEPGESRDAEGPARPTEDERTWALASHVGSFLAAYVFLGLLCPLIVLLTKGRESEFVRAHAVESLNFQITAALAAAISALLILVIVGLVLLAAVGVTYVVLVIMATVAAGRGEMYRYPVTIRFVR